MSKQSLLTKYKTFQQIYFLQILSEFELNLNIVLMKTVYVTTYVCYYLPMISETIQTKYFLWINDPAMTKTKHMLYFRKVESSMIWKIIFTHQMKSLQGGALQNPLKCKNSGSGFNMQPFFWGHCALSTKSRKLNCHKSHKAAWYVDT